MEFTLTLIRGAYTECEKEGRFLGRLDHPAHKDGVEVLRGKARAGEYPAAQAVFSSPLIRSLESAYAIYPEASITTLAQLADFDYGALAGKSYSEVIADKLFEAWAFSKKLTALPGGELPYAFFSRCSQALREIAGCARKYGLERISVVTHKLVISAMLQNRSMPGHPYCDYHPDYGGGFVTRHSDRGGLSVLKKL